MYLSCLYVLAFFLITQCCLLSFATIAQSATEIIAVANQKVEKGDFKGALQQYNVAIGANPQEAILYQNRGALRYELNDLNGSVEDCEKALKIDNTLFNCHFNLGILYHQLNQTDKALLHFDTFLAWKKNDAEALYWRGKTKQKRQDKQGACQDWREAKRLGSMQVNELLTNYCGSSQENSLEK